MARISSFVAFGCGPRTRMFRAANELMRAKNILNALENHVIVILAIKINSETKEPFAIDVSFSIISQFLSIMLTNEIFALRAHQDLTVIS